MKKKLFPIRHKEMVCIRRTWHRFDHEAVPPHHPEQNTAQHSW
jgi:hypothetical protein